MIMKVTLPRITHIDGPLAVHFEQKSNKQKFINRSSRQAVHYSCHYNPKDGRISAKVTVDMTISEYSNTNFWQRVIQTQIRAVIIWRENLKYIFLIL